MPQTTENRTHGDRNVVPSDDTETKDCPIDKFTLTHMRAVPADDADQ